MSRQQREQKNVCEPNLIEIIFIDLLINVAKS